VHFLVAENDGKSSQRSPESRSFGIGSRGAERERRNHGVIYPVEGTTFTNDQPSDATLKGSSTRSEHDTVLVPRGRKVFKSPQGCSGTHPVGKDESSRPVGKDDT
jgi:hypothetical protein